MLKLFFRFLFGKPVYTPRRSSKRLDRRETRPEQIPSNDVISGKCWVLDGDTIVINTTRIRLFGIDAPELEHPWGKKSKFHMVALCKGNTISAKLHDTSSYERVVATCYLPDGRDLSAELVKAGLALDWKKFSGGKYASLEPDGVRRKLWRAAARQQGNMKAFNAPR